MVKIYIVHGPPASGKTTYVKVNASNAALVYDFDVVMKAFTNNDLYENHPLLIDYVDSLRYELIKVAQQEGIEELWIISLRFKDKLKDAIEGFDWEAIKVIASKKECLERIENDDARKDKAYWRNLIEKYFAKASDDDE